ncbi:MAG: nitrile hydratase subunit beta [Gammaproteobacteria bacterium]
MNGIHDMGGMDGMGEIGYDADAPIFSDVWEGRVQALHAATATFRGGPLRPTIEEIPAADYLGMTYYERWLAALISRLVQTGLVTADEIESGRLNPDLESAAIAALAPTAAVATLRRTPQTESDLDIAPRFELGESVRGRNINPPRHTRMPRYTRGKVGVVERDRGVFALPDNETYDLDARPQHVYLVRFASRELWGETASVRDSVYIDMWEDYLEPG